MARVMAFVDGFNLYHSIDDAARSDPRFIKYKWLDLRKLVSLYLSKDDVLKDIYYFTSIAEWDVDKSRRHKIYIQALQNTGVKTIYGKFRKRFRECRHCHFENQFPIEKKTDVNISVMMLQSAFKGRCDKMFLVSGDTDLAPALVSIKQLFPGTILGLISPMRRSNTELKRIVNITASISEEALSDSRFPDVIEVKPGVSIQCPSEWRATTTK